MKRMGTSSVISDIYDRIFIPCSCLVERYFVAHKGAWWKGTRACSYL